MTRAVHGRLVKDANGDISDHLRNHIHLTNCIHLKNHMHKQSPILADTLLMRDRVVLPRSRSLRDPSMSPPSWHSPSVVDLLSRRGVKDAMVSNGRRSVGIECQRDDRVLLGSSPTLASRSRAKVAPGDVSGHSNRATAVSDHSSKSGVWEHQRIKKEELSGRNFGTDLMGGNDKPIHDGNDLVHDIVLGNSEPNNKKIKQNIRHRKDVHFKSLSEQLNGVRIDGDTVAPSLIYLPGKNTENEITGEEAETSIHGYHNGLNKVRRSKFQAVRRAHSGITSGDDGVRNEMSVASNSLGQSSVCSQYCMEEGEEVYAEQNVMRAPRNRCGIPWNCLSIHHRGRIFLDTAGRSLSCGLSDPKLKIRGPLHHGRDVSDMPVMSDYSSSTKSDAEVVPLLAEASGSQGGTDYPPWVHDYSGELGIFADNLLKHDIKSDLASEARSGDQHRSRVHHNVRHQNMTQKYLPRTFRDVVGQNLVVQALSNAVKKRKVGLLYLFYGSHGTGKTSCAHIFARAINCQSLEHPKPCGFCNYCTAYDMGKSRNIREVRQVSNFDSKHIMDLLDNTIVSQLPSQYRVFIFDDCDALSPGCWSAMSKVIDRAPRHVVFVLVSSSLDVLPHIITSRCQKIFFPKLKDADIIYALQWIATKEDLEIEKDALKLIASRSDGSLRDAEMTLEQLSLLGQRISVPLVQELIGLISVEKLVDLLDLALSADTVNTVKNLREIMESGVEPLALMSQLATIITDILAGTYDLTKGKSRRKFFRRQALSKADMEKLCLALKTLSEAEKQLRVSNDRLTWLTAALLQLAPHQQYMFPSSSVGTSFCHSPLVPNNAGGKEKPRKSNVECAEMYNTERGLPIDVRIQNHQAGSSSDVYYNGRKNCSTTNGKRNAGVGMLAEQTFRVSADMNRASGRPVSGEVHKVIEGIWLEVLEKIQINSIKEFMYEEGKLISISFGAAPTVQLTFSSHLTKSKAERYKTHILQAFEFVVGSPVTIEIRCEPRKDARIGINVPLILPAPQNGSSQMYTNPGLMGTNRMPMVGYDDVDKRALKDRDGLTQAQVLQYDSLGMGRGEIVEIVEIVASPREPNGSGYFDNNTQLESTVVFLPEQGKSGDKNQSQSLVRSKVSLGHVIHPAEGCTERNGWLKCKAVSIAEKLEQDNLILEPRQRGLLCWKASSKVPRRKLSRLKIRMRKPQTLLKFVSCGKCLSDKSPRQYKISY